MNKLLISGMKMKSTIENTPRCPKCKLAIQNDDINIAKDIAYCRSCNLAHKFSNVISSNEILSNIDVNKPPAGVKCQMHGKNLNIEASNRSLGAGFGVLLFVLFWNGIVSIFVIVAVSATLNNFDVPRPHWFPKPEMNGKIMESGEITFLWIFLTPFILIGLAMIVWLLLIVVGKTKVKIDGADSSVFTGIGFLGYRQHFIASEVVDVRVEDKQWRDNDGDRRREKSIAIETHKGKIVRFGALLSEERRKFMIAALHLNLLH